MTTTCYLPPRDGLERQLVHLWEEILAVHPIGITDNFFEIGGHSLLALRMMTGLEQRIGQVIPLGRLFEVPTIAGLASLLRRDSEPVENSCLVAMRPEGVRPPLFFLPGVGGIVGYLYSLARHIDQEIPFYAFQAQGVDGYAAPHENIEEMAAHYVKLLQEVQPHGPYFLAGHSFGGRLGLAIAQILRAQSEVIGMLTIIDTTAPGTDSDDRYMGTVDEVELLAGIAELMARLFCPRIMIMSREELAPLASEERLAFLARRLEEAELLPKGRGERYLRGLCEVYRTNLRMFANYAPQATWPVPITLIRAETAPSKLSASMVDETWGWQRYADRPVAKHEVPGDHYSMLAEPHVQVLACLLTYVMGSGHAIYS